MFQSPAGQGRSGPVRAGQVGRPARRPDEPRERARTVPWSRCSTITTRDRRRHRPPSGRLEQIRERHRRKQPGPLAGQPPVDRPFGQRRLAPASTGRGGDRRPGLCLLNRRSDLPEDLPVTLGQPGQQLRLGMSGHRGILTWPGGSWYASVSGNDQRGQMPSVADLVAEGPLGRLATPDTPPAGQRPCRPRPRAAGGVRAAAGDGPGPGHRRQLPGGVPLGQRWAHLVVHLPGRPGRRILQGAGGRAGFSTRPPSRVWPGSPSVGRGAARDPGARAARPVGRRGAAQRPAAADRPRLSGV
jgi:hypothetical protein